MKPEPQKCVLIGGGHAHVGVLADWIRNGVPFAEACLVTPSEKLRYSGTVPGWIAGQYPQEFGEVDCAALARKAGVELVLGECVEIDLQQGWVGLADGCRVGFDMASLNTGGVGQAEAMLGADPRLLDVRPVQGFVEALAAKSDAAQIAVIGGGAGGVELAFALRNRNGWQAPPNVTLIAGNAGLLSDFAASVRRKVAAELAKQGVALIEENARLEDGQLMAGKASLEPVDLIVAALAAPPIGLIVQG